MKKCYITFIVCSLMISSVEALESLSLKELSFTNAAEESPDFESLSNEEIVALTIKNIDTILKYRNIQQEKNLTSELVASTLHLSKKNKKYFIKMLADAGNIIRSNPRIISLRKKYLEELSKAIEEESNF